MINWSEQKTIKNTIQKTSNKINEEHWINKKFVLISNLFSWLERNGGYVLVDTKIKKLKTKDKYIETYITRWGVKFQVIKDEKYHKCSKLQIKI